MASNTQIARTPSHWSECGPQPTISVNDKRIFICLRMLRRSAPRSPLHEAVWSLWPWDTCLLEKAPVVHTEKEQQLREQECTCNSGLSTRSLGHVQGWNIGICGQNAEASGDLTNSGVIKSSSRWLHGTLSLGYVANLHCQLGQALCSFWASFSLSWK